MNNPLEDTDRQETAEESWPEMTEEDWRNVPTRLLFNQARDAFLALLDADPEPTEAAKRAAAEYKKGRHVGGKYYFTLISNLPTSI